MAEEARRDPEDVTGEPDVRSIAPPGHEPVRVDPATIDTSGATGEISDESAEKLERLTNDSYLSDKDKLARREGLQESKRRGRQKAEAQAIREGGKP